MKDELSDNGWDIKKLMNHFSLIHSHVYESGVETFEELIESDPEQGIKRFPEFLGKVLNVGNGFFRGIGCGGPYPGVTGPLINKIGLVYPCLNREMRTKALSTCLNFLDGLNYSNSQENVSQIDEPWLVGDIIDNRPLYWPGFREYSQKLESMVSWYDFEAHFLCDGKLRCDSVHFLGRAISKEKYCSGEIRTVFCEVFPEIVDRLKDVIAWDIHCMGLEGEVEKESVPYSITIEEMLSEYPYWKHELREKLKQENWILLPDYFQRLEHRKNENQRSLNHAPGEI